MCWSDATRRSPIYATPDGNDRDRDRARGRHRVLRRAGRARPRPGHRDVEARRASTISTASRTWSPRTVSASTSAILRRRSRLAFRGATTSPRATEVVVHWTMRGHVLRQGQVHGLRAERQVAGAARGRRVPGRGRQDRLQPRIHERHSSSPARSAPSRRAARPASAAMASAFNAKTALAKRLGRAEPVLEAAGWGLVRRLLARSSARRSGARPVPEPADRADPRLRRRHARQRAHLRAHRGGLRARRRRRRCDRARARRPRLLHRRLG